MTAFERQSSCAHPESLVLVEVVPLCRVGASGEPWEGPLEGGGDLSAPVERPLRCAAAMSCAEAFALLEEVGHVAW